MGKEQPYVKVANVAGDLINPSTEDKQKVNLYAEGYTMKLLDNIHQDIPNRGAQFEVDACVHAPMETMSNQDDLVKTLIFGSGDTGVCQIFRASSDNLHDARFTIKGSGAAATIDNMEYASDAAARAVWVASDATNTDVISENTIVYQGTYSLGVRCRKNQSPGDTITKTISATDYTDGVIRFRRYNTVGGGKCIWKIRISDDGTDWLESQFTSISANEWEEINITVNSMTLSGTDVNKTIITKVQFYMVSCISPDHFWYVDQLELLSAAGTIEFKLYDFGTTTSPTNLSDGTQLTFDEGDTSITIVPPPNKSIVNVHAHYGTHQRDNKLTVGNY